MTGAEQEQNTLTIEYELSPEEAKRLETLLDRAKRGAENSRLKYWLILAVIAIPLGIRGYQMIREAGVGWLGVLAVIWVIVFFILRKSSSAKKDAWRRKTRLTVDGHGLIFEDGLSLTDLPWASISRASEAGEFFLITRDGTNWHFIPRRAFASETAESFGQLLRDHVAGSELRRAMQLPPLRPPSAEPQTWRVRYPFLLTLPESFDLAVASWTLRSLVLLIVTIHVAVCVMILIKPPDNDPVRMKDLFLAGIIPICVLTTFLSIVTTLRTWWVFKSRQSVMVALDVQGVSFSGPGGDHSSAWTTFHRYKETRKSFVVWQRHSRNYFIIPKRALDDAARRWLEQTLSSKLERSTWFFLI